jgi:phosphonate transport system substrate-binding protein
MGKRPLAAFPVSIASSFEGCATGFNVLNPGVMPSESAINSRFLAALAVLLLGVGATTGAHAQAQTLSFGVISQRSPVLTAQYWNPILRYVSGRSGVPLQLKLAKTGTDHAAAVGRGEFDILYSNHNFTRRNQRVGYTVFARPIDATIRGQLVVLASSPIRGLDALVGKEVAFPSNAAFVGYHVPMDALIRNGVNVVPRFAGNQEGAMGQLTSGRAAAASVNSKVMRDFATRENVDYRVIWNSEEFLNIPLSAHPSVPKDKVASVRAAFVAMVGDPEGVRILATSAALIRQLPPYGFVVANDAEYENVSRFYRNSLVKDE